MENQDIDENGDEKEELSLEMESKRVEEELTPSEEELYERAARTLSANRAKRRRYKHVKQKLQVLTVLCPHSACRKPVQMLCPLCHQGALECEEHSLALVCHNCHNTMRHLPCPHCRFIIKPSYIMERQHHMTRLIANADGSKFIATIVVFATMFFTIWAILTILA